MRSQAKRQPHVKGDATSTKILNNLGYYISFVLFLFFPLNTCAQKALFNESLQRNLFNLKLRFAKKKLK